MPSVTIAAHSRVYTDGAVSVAGSVTLTVYDDASSIANGDAVYIYYDDAARTGGAVTYKATKSAGTAMTSGAHPFRHFVGYVTVPAIGGGTTSGTGSKPPGYGGGPIP